MHEMDVNKLYIEDGKYTTYHILISYMHDY